MKVEVDKLSIAKLVKSQLVWLIQKIKVDDVDVDKLKNVSRQLKKLSVVLKNEVVKNTTFSTLKTKVNDLEEQIPDAITLIQINQYR